MGTEFWRTIRMAIEKDNETGRLAVALCAAAVAVLGAYAMILAR